MTRTAINIIVAVWMLLAVAVAGGVTVPLMISVVWQSAAVIRDTLTNERGERGAAQAASGARKSSRAERAYAASAGPQADSDRMNKGRAAGNSASGK